MLPGGMPMVSELLSTRDAAQILGLSAATLRPAYFTYPRMAKNGKYSLQPNLRVIKAFLRTNEVNQMILR